MIIVDDYAGYLPARSIAGDRILSNEPGYSPGRKYGLPAFIVYEKKETWYGDKSNIPDSTVVGYIESDVSVETKKDGRAAIKKAMRASEVNESHF